MHITKYIYSWSDLVQASTSVFYFLNNIVWAKKNNYVVQNVKKKKKQTREMIVDFWRNGNKSNDINIADEEVEVVEE